MMETCFTGTRWGMKPNQLKNVRELLDIAQPCRVHHGCAKGADRQFHALAEPGTRDMHPCNWEQLAWAQANVVQGDVIHMIDEPLARNRRMVDGSTLIIAAPRGVEEEQRSGTWATIRYARQSKDGARPHIYIAVILPSRQFDGTITEEECRAGNERDEINKLFGKATDGNQGS